MSAKYNYQKEFRDAIKQAIQPWVEWKHIPTGITHCPTCLRLDQCWFSAVDMPQLPQHEYCHCTAISVATSQIRSHAHAYSDYGKYDPYLFDPSHFYKHGKDKLCYSWGYTISDCAWLKEEIERQGLEKYVSGQYTLNKLDRNGQRINIVIEIPRKDRVGTVAFTTGWMVYPKGNIKLSTPYGDN